MTSGIPVPGVPASVPQRLVPAPRHAVTGLEFAFGGASLDAEASCEAAADLIAGSGVARAADRGGSVLSVQIGCARDGRAWRELAGMAPEADERLPSEGYLLAVADTDSGPRAVVAGADPAGAYYGTQSLLAMAASADGGWRLPSGTITDWPELQWRGTIEGFYGPPWSHDDRLAHLRFAGRHKLNTYVYAPKDDPFHRARWRDPYPESELARLRELVTVAKHHHVRFVFTISPGLSMVYSDPDELGRLFGKLEQVWEIGVRDIGLLFDDIEPELAHEPDRARFGTEPGSSARAHAHVCRQVIERFLGPRGSERSLVMVPTDYAGTASSPYREFLAEELPRDVLVWWTGRDIVVGEVSRGDIEAAAETYGHRLLLWDNFPVNDFDFSRVFLGPLTGRTADPDSAALAGVTANPMPQAAASQIALATVADWAWNPRRYDPASAHRRVVAELGGGAAVATLIESCSAWPPSAPQHPGLIALTEQVRSGVDGAAELLAARLTALTRTAEPTTPDGARLARELQPWLDAQAAMGRAGLAALAYLATPSPKSRAVAENALAEAQGHEPNVLRSVIPPFVEAVLGRPVR